MVTQRGLYTGRAASSVQGWAEPWQQKNSSTRPRERPLLCSWLTGRPLKCSNAPLILNVAITRARNELYLSYPLVRMMPGNSGDAMQSPSRFLNEIPRALLDEWNLKPSHSYG